MAFPLVKQTILASMLCVGLSVGSLANADETIHENDCIPHNTVLIPASDESISFVDLIDQVKDKRVVLLGEHHDNIEHHRWQLQMIAGLHTLNPDLILGFEMFPREVQPVLEQWIAGELTEEDFLKAARWAEYWSFDKSLYVPLFHYARMNRIPMVALNVERALIRKVGKEGWDNIPVNEREGVSKAHPASQGYRELLAGVFMRHDSKHGEKTDASDEKLKSILANPSFNRFVESQSVWDRAMAEGIARGSRANGDAQVVAVMGSGHMMYGFGVPEQLTALDIPKPAVLIPWDPEFECDYISPGFADAVIGLRTSRFSQLNKKNRPLLGVYLERGENGVRVTKVVKDSVAEKVGVKENDLIVEMAGNRVTEVDEVIKTVKAMQFGTWLPFVVSREEKGKAQKRVELVAKFPLKEE